jgi:hypothetical protein
MFSQPHPLAKEFNLPIDDGMSYETAEIVIPEARDLDAIRDLSLNAYKDQMDSIALIEPKNRLKFLEIAQAYLNTAKDAIYKKELLILKAKSMKSNKPDAGTTILEEEDDQGLTNRNDLYKD